MGEIFIEMETARAVNGKGIGKARTDEIHRNEITWRVLMVTIHRRNVTGVNGQVCFRGVDRAVEQGVRAEDNCIIAWQTEVIEIRGIAVVHDGVAAQSK